jgi:hypothetical protein
MASLRDTAALQGVGEDLIASEPRLAVSGADVGLWAGVGAE